MPIGTNHFVETKEETVIQLHGIGPWDVTYVNPEDDPPKAIARGGFGVPWANCAVQPEALRAAADGKR